MSAVILPGDHLTSAVELVRALRDQHNEITRQLVWLEYQQVTGTNSQAAVIRCLAAMTASHRGRRQVIWASRRPAVSAATAHGWNGPEGGSSTQMLDSGGNLSTRLSAGAAT
jgi:hypothetical protein